MYRFVQKNVKFFNSSRFQISTNCFYRQSAYLRLCYTVFVSHYKSLATIAHKYNSTYNSENIKNTEPAKTNQISLQDIDKAISDIDYNVRRTGRTLYSSVENVFAMVENIGFSSGKQSLSLLRCCGLLRFESPVKRVDFANKMWSKFQLLGVPFDVKHYNALLEVYLDNNHEFSPFEVLISMEHQKINPNQVTYSHLIEKFCKDGNLNGANEILEHMKEKEIPVNEAIFISLIKGHITMNDIAGAEEIIEVMRSNNISSKMNSYSALACGFAKKGNFDKVEEILLEAERSQIVFSDDHYFKMIMSLESTDYVDEILGKMKNTQEMQQDFINAAMDLIHKDLDAIAYKLILANSSAENNSSINMFLKLLIKSNKPIEKIVQYSNEIYEKGLSRYIYTNIAKASLEYEKFDYSISFFDEMHKRGIPVRMIYFWPIFVGYRHSPDAVWKILRKMSDFGLMSDFFTYIEYILPALSSLQPDVIISKIQDCGQSSSAAIDPLFEYYCLVGKLDYATNLIEKYNAHVSPFFQLERYISLYDKFKQNPSTYFKILKYIMENTGLPMKNNSGIQGRNLAVFLQTNPDLFEAFHKSSNGKSCQYSEECLEVCRNIVRKKAPHLFVYLQNLRSYILKKRSQNQSKYVHLTKLLTFHIRNRDVERFNQVKSELDSVGFVIAPVTYAQMFSLYCDISDFDAARDVLKKLKNLHPTFQLDSSKMFDYARLLLKFSKFDESLDIIKNECKEINYFGGTDMMLKSFRRFLNCAVQTGNIEFLKAVHDALIHQAQSLQLTPLLLEPLIKFYLHRDDYENCLKEFNNCVTKYSCTPCLNLLMKKMILAGEDQKLQTIMDLAAKVDGKIKVLHKLFSVLINLNHLDQAKKVFQNLQGNIDFGYLEEMCEVLFSQSKTVELESVLHITRGFKQKNRDEMYHQLLKLYDRKNDWKKASLTLDLMAEENIEPSQKSKELINHLFKKNSHPEPFKSDLQSSCNMGNNSLILSFSNFLNDKDAVQALKELEKMKKGVVKTLPLADIARLIDLLVEKNLLKDLSTNTSVMTYIIEHSGEVFKSLLEKYSQSGNVEGIMSLTNIFPDFALKKGSYSTFLAKAFIASNRQEDLLIELENRWDKKNNLFSAYAFEELIKYTHLEERVVRLAKTYLEVNFDFPIAVVWVHYFTSEKYDKADEINQIHPIPVDKIDSIVFRVMRHSENISMGKKYIAIVNQINSKSRSKERAYGFLLDLLVLKHLYDDATDLVVDAQKLNINLEKHYNSTLMTLINALERENKPVPFKNSSEK